MGTTNISETRSYGQAVVDRFSAIIVPAALKPYFNAFKDAHRNYEVASVRVEVARQKRDEALEAVANADDVFDPSVNELADKLVGAGIGKRQNPFAQFSKYSPSALTSLPYAKEPEAIRTLVAALMKVKPSNEVAKSSAKCVKNATTIESALAKLTKPQAAYVKAIADRDGLLLAWTKTLRKLKLRAAVAWEDDEGTLKALFAPVEAIQVPKRRRASKAKKPNAAIKAPAQSPG